MYIFTISLNSTIYTCKKPTLATRCLSPASCQLLQLLFQVTQAAPEALDGLPKLATLRAQREALQVLDADAGGAGLQAKIQQFLGRFFGSAWRLGGFRSGVPPVILHFHGIFSIINHPFGVIIQLKMIFFITIQLWVYHHVWKPPFSELIDNVPQTIVAHFLTWSELMKTLRAI